MVHLPTATIREVVDEFFNVKVVELFVEAEQFVVSEFFNIEVEAEFFNIEVVDEVFVFAALRHPGFSTCP